MKIFTVRHGNIYDGLDVYGTAYTDKLEAEKKALELEKEFDDEMEGDYDFRDQYRFLVVELELQSS